MFIKVILLFIILVPQLANANTYAILHCREGVGMFSMMFDVITLLKLYDRGEFKGAEVNFNNHGIYFDRSHGKNWWNYYFYPIKIGNKRSLKIQHFAHFAEVWGAEKVGSQEYIDDTFKIFNKYVHPKPFITKSINYFVEKNMKDQFMIGVHYRGTDKITETPRMPYEKVYNAITDVLSKLSHENCKIFVATDETKFIEYLLNKGLNICYVEECLRSTNETTPVHLNSISPFKAGFDAIVDCILLSKCNFLIKTESNLSFWSIILNPQIQVIDIK